MAHKFTRSKNSIKSCEVGNMCDWLFILLLLTLYIVPTVWNWWFAAYTVTLTKTIFWRHIVKEKSGDSRGVRWCGCVAQQQQYHWFFLIAMLDQQSQEEIKWLTLKALVMRCKRDVCAEGRAAGRMCSSRIPVASAGMRGWAAQPLWSSGAMLTQWKPVLRSVHCEIWPLQYDPSSVSHTTLSCVCPHHPACAVCYS